MDNQVEQMFLMNASKIPAVFFEDVKQRLASCDPNKAMFVLSELKDPTIAIILGIFLGGLGIDRFYIDSVGIGIGKLLTCGGLGIWYLIDLFLIIDATKQKNYEIIRTYCS